MEIPTDAVNYGPYGSSKETNWSVELGRCEYIKEVLVNHGWIVDGIGFVIADASGLPCPAKWFGGRGGDASRITMRSNEYITRISGKYGRYAHARSEITIGSLRIHTNLWPSGYGPYGEVKLVDNIQSFSTPLQTSDTVVKLYGTYHAYLGSIGIHVRK